MQYIKIPFTSCERNFHIVDACLLWFCSLRRWRLSLSLSLVDSSGVSTDPDCSMHFSSVCHSDRGFGTRMPVSEQYIFTLQTAWHLGRRMTPSLSIMYDLLMVSTIIFTEWRLTAVSMLIVQYSITSPGQTRLSGVEVTSSLDQLSFMTGKHLVGLLAVL